jgi:hypothetical protein
MPQRQRQFLLQIISGKYSVYHLWREKESTIYVDQHRNKRQLKDLLKLTVKHPQVDKERRKERAPGSQSTSYEQMGKYTGWLLCISTTGNQLHPL